MKRFLAILLPVIVPVIALFFLFFLLGAKRLTFIGNQEYAIISLILVSLELIGLIFAIYIVIFIFLQYFRFSRRHRLVFEAFSNEPELVDAENKPLNLSMLAREELIRQFKTIYNELKGYSHKVSQEFEAWAADELYIGEEPSGNNIGTYISVDELNKSQIIEGLEEVIKTLKDPEDINLMHLVGEITPQEISPVVKFIEAIIPPHSIRATGHLQGWREIPGRVGITFEFVDLGNRRDLMVRTIWSPAVEPDKANNPSANKLTDYYIELLKPAMYWMALMFWEQKLLAQVPTSNRILKPIFAICENRRQARILYLLGALYYAHADHFPAYRDFFRQLAFEHLRQASVKDPNWPLPYLYLANLYSFKAQESAGKKYEKLYKEAQGLYKEALKQTNETDVNTRARINLAMALADLDSGVRTTNLELVNEAIQVVEKLKKQLDPADFDPRQGDIAGYLYNLAIFYGRVYDESIPIPNVKVRDEARRYLAYSLARSQSLRDTADKALEEKPDENFENDENMLKSMRDEGDLKILLEILKEAFDKKPGENHKLDELSGEDFKSEIDKMLATVDQRLGR